MKGYIYNFKVSINFCITKSQKPLILKCEYWSNRVYWIFIIQSFPYGWYFSGNKGTLDDGFTLSEDPITTHKSDCAAFI